MSEVKRYDGKVSDSDEGGYVSLVDYAVLKAECESNLKSAQYSAETNRKIALKNGEMHDEIISLKAERDALANENLAIKAKIAIHAGGFSVCPVCSHEEPSETDDVVWMVNETPTPATDAYLNSVRAEGVEMFADNQIRVAERHDADNRPVWAEERRLSADQARTFAAKLRKEQHHES